MMLRRLQVRARGLGQEQVEKKVQAVPGDFYCPAANFAPPSGLEAGIQKTAEAAGTVAAAAGGAAEKAGQTIATAADVTGTIVSKAGTVTGAALDLVGGIVGAPAWLYHHLFGVGCYGLGIVPRSNDEVIVSPTSAQTWAENNQCSRMVCRSADTGASKTFYSCHAEEQAAQQQQLLQQQALQQQQQQAAQSVQTQQVVKYVAIGGAVLGGLFLIMSLLKKD